MIENLRWIRVFTPDHIPRKYVEQLKGVNFNPDDFYNFQRVNCLIPGREIKLNPLNHLYVLVNEKNAAQGFLWYVVDPLTKDIVIQNFSVDQLYWGKGKIIEKLASHVKDVKKKAKLNKIYWITRAPKHSEKYGFKRSRDVLMEYTEEQDGKFSQRSISESSTRSIDGRPVVGGSQSHGECGITDGRTTIVSRESDGQPDGLRCLHEVNSGSSSKDVSRTDDSRDSTAVCKRRGRGRKRSPKPSISASGDGATGKHKPKLHELPSTGDSK